MLTFVFLCVDPDVSYSYYRFPGLSWSIRSLLRLGSVGSYSGPVDGDTPVHAVPSGRHTVYSRTLDPEPKFRTETVLDVETRSTN